MLSKDEIDARAIRLNPNRAVDRYTGTLNDPYQEAQRRYMGPRWDNFFGSLAKEQEDAQNAGKSYRIGWGGFGTGYSTEEQSMPRTTRGQTLASMGTDAPDDGLDANLSLARMVDQNRARLIQDKAYAEQQQQEAIDAMKRSYQEHVLASAVPLAPKPDMTVAKVNGNPAMGGLNAPPVITLRPNASETAQERIASLLPGSAQTDLMAQFGKQNLAAKAQQDAADVAKQAAGMGPPEEYTADPPDPKTANVVNPRTGLTPNALHQNSESFALTEKLPSMGMGGKGPVTAARMAIQNKAGALAAAAGVDLPTLRQEYRTNQSTLNTLMPRYKMLAAASDTANKNLQLALDQSANVPRTGSPLVNRFEQFALGHTLTGDPQLTKLENYIYSAAREYAKVVGGGVGSVAEVSQSGAKKAEELLNAAQTPEQFKAALDAMQHDMNNVASPLLNQINQSSPNVAKFLATVHGQNVPEGEPAGSSAPAATPRGPAPGRDFSAPVEGATRGIPQIPGGLAKFVGGKWVRVQ